jgi:CheY-like chemotaxis protein
MNDASFASLRVLVVDDHSFVRRALSGVLSRCGVGEVLEAEDGDAALEFLADRERAIDVVFCDLSMPTRDGIELLREMAAAHSQCGVVIMSAQDAKVLSAAANLARQSGLRLLGVHPKPVGFNIIMGILRANQNDQDQLSGRQLPTFQRSDLLQAIENK